MEDIKMQASTGSSGSDSRRVAGIDPSSSRLATGYMQVENYGLIGNMRTCAYVGQDGGLDFMCWPDFDSPSVFCRMLDKDKGGHFSIAPEKGSICTTKQQYLPLTNVLQTRHLSDDGVLNIIDFFPRPNEKPPSPHLRPSGTLRVPSPAFINPSRSPQGTIRDEPKKWLVRRVECIRGTVTVEVEVFPAFNYARDKHTIEFKTSESIGGNDHTNCNKHVLFQSESLSLDLTGTLDCGSDHIDDCPKIEFEKRTSKFHLGPGVVSKFTLTEGQGVSFVLRDANPNEIDNARLKITPNLMPLSSELLDYLQNNTQSFWQQWISQSKYKGRWREVVSRSLLILKLMTFEPTGAIVAAPTFSLPEDFGGGRNWDYRYCWVRDSSFTIYILLKMGFREEAEAYMAFIADRIKNGRLPDGNLPIMFSIRGSTDLEEIELTHLDGYRSSRPVRIGNGAATHLQLDIYGELLDAIYLYNKHGSPISYSLWVSVREIADHVCRVWNKPDMSIWEVRGEPQNFVYSKIMLWVALDRSLRLADKRSNLPCPNRDLWAKTRDQIYEEVMTKGYNEEMGCFIQSFESREMLDSAVLIAPLVFFVAPNEPRFLSTLDQILKAPEKGGLTSVGLVYRYNWLHSDDGVGGREGAFSMCTFWLVEALTRAGAFDRTYLVRAADLFENMLNYSNHVNMFSEEIARSGEQLGNTPQAFSHLALISAAFNLDKVLEGKVAE